MKFLITISLFTVSFLFAEKILVLNSNNSIEKYSSVEKSFQENIIGDVKSLDISSMKNKQIKDYLYDEYPDIVYTIGTKAYKYANIYIPEKTLFFSSIVNYQRLDVTKNRFGVSNELHTGMNLTIIKSLFPNTQKLSIVYSSYTKELFDNFKQNALQIGIEIIGEEISEDRDMDIQKIQNSDGLILIADPLLLKDEQKVLSLFEKVKMIKKPIFAYNELFIKFDATLIISADNPTIGRQVASMINQYVQKEDFTPIQMPMGTNVIFNKKVADELELKYNKNGLSLVNRVLE
jgi:putative ABC transport system substrate-binding protein